MAGTVQDVLDIARSQIGVDSGRRYFEDMGDAWWGQAWCARFGRWVFWKAGVDCHWPYDVAFDERDVPSKYRVGKYDLQAGDTFCMDWLEDGWRDGKGDHFGIVQSVHDWGVSSIEGNAGNPGKVREEQRLWDCIICGIRPTYKVSEGQWRKSGERWWYAYNGGGYPKAELKEIDGQKYLFDSDGWMVTGWAKADGAWRYFDKTKGRTEGQMLRSTVINDGTGFYALGADGAMLTGDMTNPEHDGTFGRLML